MIQAFDVDALNKGGFDFNAAAAEGYTHCYIKLGGCNLYGNQPYLMTSNGGYHGQVDAALAAGMGVLNYFVTGGSDTVGAAKYVLENRDPRTSGDILDNEELDYGRVWSDGEAATFFDTLAAGGLTENRFMYGSRLSLWESSQWPYCQARGIKAIVADYNGTPLQGCYPSTYPVSLVKGHQYTDAGQIGGLTGIDLDAFTDDAFAAPPSAAPSSKGNTMYVYGDQLNPNAPVTGTPYVYEIWTALDGTPQMRLCGVYEAAAALAHDGLCGKADDGTITGLATECNYKGTLPGLTLTDAQVTQIVGQIQPVSADEIAQATTAALTPAIQSIKVPTTGTATITLNTNG